MLSVSESGVVAFALSDVRAALRPQAFARGAAYVRGGRISDLKLSNGGNSITAHVRGTESLPYDVTAYVSRARDGRTIVSGSCTCPVGIDCKHVAAALLAALDLRHGPQSAAVPAPHSMSEPVPFLRARHSSETAPASVVDLWLNEIHETIPVTASGAALGDERIAYVFGGPVTSARTFDVEIVVTRYIAHERYAKVRDATPESLAAAVARAVAPEDALVGRFIEVYEKTYRERMPLAEEIVRRIIATGRAHYERLETRPLALGPARKARIEWTLGSDGTQRPSVLFEDSQTIVFRAPVPWYVDPQSGVVGPIDAGLPNATLGALLVSPPLHFSHAKRLRDSFVGTIADFAIPPPLESAEPIVRIEPVPILRLRTIEIAASPYEKWRSDSAASQTVDVAEWSFAYGDAIVNPGFRAAQGRGIEGEPLVYERSLAGEERAAERLRAIGFVIDVESRRLPQASGVRLRLQRDGGNDWASFAHRSVAALQAEGWRVEIDASFRHRIVDVSGDDAWEPRARERSDGWFDVAIDLDVDGRRVDLLSVLRDLAQRSDALGDLEALGADEFYYVTLPDAGPTLAFPAERLKAIARTLVELGDPGALRADGTLRLPRSRSTIVDELEMTSGLRFEAPQRLRALGARLRTFAGLVRAEVPSSFRGELRAYQRDGLDWLQFLAEFGLGGILADDMGLGKSIQTLAHLLCEKEAGRLTQPALLVVPTSLVFNWRDEVARFAPSLRVLALHGPARAERFGEIAEHDLVITTYALLVRDTALHEPSWHAVILDEAQALKNPQSKAAQVAMALRASHRLCLTGTPVENHLGDLWSLFSIALPGTLGDRKQFARVFRTPIEKRGDATRKRALAQLIAPFVLRRTKEAVASDLPEKTEILQRIELTGAQRDLYETVRLAMRRRVREEIAQRGVARSQIVVFDALLKLRQVCCDPRLLPERMRVAAESVKLSLLLVMLPQIIDEGRRVLVFSQFTSMIDLMVPALETLAVPFVVLTGETRDRESVVKRFQRGDVPVFLISLKAGGTGLNLTAADTVIHYDPWWNPAVERQATDRAHRIGQTQHVFVYKFIAAGTVEERIVDLQARKSNLAAAILSENADFDADFAAEDLELLFGPLER